MSGVHPDRCLLEPSQLRPPGTSARPILRRYILYDRRIGRILPSFLKYSIFVTRIWKLPASALRSNCFGGTLNNLYLFGICADSTSLGYRAVSGSSVYRLSGHFYATWGMDEVSALTVLLALFFLNGRSTLQAGLCPPVNIFRVNSEFLGFGCFKSLVYFPPASLAVSEDVAGLVAWSYPGGSWLPSSGVGSKQPCLYIFTTAG